MKKLFLLLAAATLFSVTACDKNDDGKNDDGPTAGDFVMNNVKVEVSFAADNKTADIEILQVKFAEEMPVTLDIVIPGVTVTEADGSMSLSGDNIVPLMNTPAGSVPVAKYTITGLTGSAAETGLMLSMTIGDYPTTYSGALPIEDGPYIGTVTVKQD